MLAIASPFPQFFDVTGAPLSAGSLYFGVVNLNPQTNPVTVFWDAEGTQPAQQPVRTLNGYAVRNGTPALVYATSGYSLTARNVTGATVFYAPDSSNFSNAQLLETQITQAASGLANTSDAAKGDALVGVMKSIAGAVGTTQHSINERAPISVFDVFTADQVADAKTGAPTIDVTNKVQALITACALLKRELVFEGAILCGTLSIDADDVQWTGRAGARVVQKPSTYPTDTYQVTVSGDRPYVKDIVFDGNQYQMSMGQGCNTLLITGKSPTFVNVSTLNSSKVGCKVYSNNGGLETGNFRDGAFIDCHFDDNAGLGIELITAAYITFFGGSADRNGFGFQGSRASYADTSHGFAAFGAAVRYQSHHIDFIGTRFRDNGREGLNINQGSYAIKLAQCLAYGNDDGGFTIAADNDGNAAPGEGQACFDISLTDCEAYNNYTSGLAVYQTANGISVIGGRYYNNHRVAGDQASASSFFSGIYFAGGCSGINVDTKAYDERQTRLITAVSGSGATRTLTAAGWIPSGAMFYPKVAIYAGTDQSFLGYGKIVSETNGGVTIKATAFNAVNLAAVAAGMYVSQAVQHNGLLADNGCQGQVAVDGFGYGKGVFPYSGRKICATYYGSNTNIFLPKERVSTIELLLNPSFDAGIANWTFVTPTGGSATAYTGSNRRSTAAVQLVGGTSAPSYGDASTVTDTLLHCQGEFVEYGAWCFALARGDAQLTLFTNAGGLSSTVVHPGGGWRYLRISLQVDPTDTGVVPRIYAAATKTVVFDKATFHPVDMATDPHDFQPVSRSLPV